MKRFSIILAFIALLQLAGGHWAVLQTAAWIHMFVGYAQTHSLTGSLAKTLDPALPCSLCKKIQEGKASERQNPAIVYTSLKIEGVVGQFASLVHQPRTKDFSYLLIDEAPWTSRSDEPPQAVPRLSC